MKEEFKLNSDHGKFGDCYFLVDFKLGHKPCSSEFPVSQIPDSYILVGCYVL